MLSPSPPLFLMECPLAGFQFHAGEAHWNRLKANDRVTLRRERGNRHDARAVAVEWQGVMLGYVPREANFALSQMLDRGERLEGRIARLQSGPDPWKRIGLALFACGRESQAHRPIPMPVKSAAVPWHRFADPPPGDGTFDDALRILLLSHDEIGRRLALPALAVSHLGRRSVRLWDAIEISVSDAGHNLAARFLEASTASPQLTADLTSPVGTWSAAFVPYLGRVCDESHVSRKVLCGASGRWIHGSLRRTFEGHVDLGELRRRILEFLAPDILARSLANRIFPLAPTATDFNWVARHREPIALSAIEHPRLLPFLRYRPSESERDDTADPLASLKARFSALGMAPAAFARLERWGFEAFVAFDVGDGDPDCRPTAPSIVDYANLLLEVDACDVPPPLFGRLAAHVAVRQVAAPEWFMRALLRATIQAPDDDLERMTMELHDALDWLVECGPQPDANQRKSGWPWIVDQSWAYVARRNAQCWPVPCGELRIASFVVMPLSNAAELREEAAALHNCLDTYAPICLEGDTVVFSMRDARTGKRLACFLAERVLERPPHVEWAIVEIKEKMNRPAGPRILAIAATAVSKLNGG